MAKLRIEECGCGKPIFEALPVIIIDTGILERYSAGKNPRTKTGMTGAKNKSFLKMCMACREEHLEKVHNSFRVEHE
ncbi:MAG TPA: hypothetical protein VMW42_05185 [Desulfatiglandales bacterium]|nr:hypothetical protein [Desulfatiglandales bacterium]